MLRKPERLEMWNDGRDVNNARTMRQSTKIPPNALYRHKTTLISRTTCAQHYFLLILVSSAPPNIQRRNDIRRTWGVDIALHPRWRTAFLVAQTQNKNVSDSLLKEEDAFRDLVRAEYVDHYWNQTLKIQMGFEWASLYCNFSFLLKMDDDTFVYPQGLISFLTKKTTPQEKLYLGRCFKSPVVKRKGKWKINFDEFYRTNYPDFCAGFGFAVSVDVVDLFVALFNVVPTFRVDDVYVGMLAKAAGVNPISNVAFSVYGLPLDGPCVLHEKILVWHGVTGKCLDELWKAKVTL